MSEELIQWLFDNSGPIIKYRIATEILKNKQESNELKVSLLQSEEVKKWISNLKNIDQIHSSKDTSLENVFGKLLDYGLNSSFQIFDDYANKFSKKSSWNSNQYDPIVAIPFLIRAGYHMENDVHEWFLNRIESLYKTACEGSYDFFRTSEEMKVIPNTWQNELIFKSKYDNEYGLPTCYDLYAMAYYPKTNEELTRKFEKIVDYLIIEKFQSIDTGFIYDENIKRCYSAGKVWLAVIIPKRLLLFMELFSRIKSTIYTGWFNNIYLELLKHKNEFGRFSFPKLYLAEKSNSYHLYSGAHMSLGEDRRNKNSLEIESTFRMLLIQMNIFNIIK